MKIAIISGFAVGMSVNLCWAASPPGGKPTKPAPACAAIAFRALPGGGADGEKTAGLYKSRLARLELRATVQNGAPANYYLVANGNRLAAAKSGLPAAAESCTTAKKMPKPQAVSASCTGGRFALGSPMANRQWRRDSSPSVMSELRRKVHYLRSRPAPRADGDQEEWTARDVRA